MSIWTSALNAKLFKLAVAATVINANNVLMFGITIAHG